jgi:hypothetical protein
MTLAQPLPHRPGEEAPERRHAARGCCRHPLLAVEKRLDVLKCEVGERSGQVLRGQPQVGPVALDRVGPKLPPLQVGEKGVQRGGERFHAALRRAMVACLL